MRDELSQLAAGTMLGRFEVVRVLGSGGMATVYEARDPTLARSVALKLLRSGGGGGHARLLREAHALARLAHPNVVSVHEVGVADGRAFVAMDYIDGRTLGEHLAAERPSLPEILSLFIAAGRGLVAAHAQGLVHRDFKPGNVLVDREGHVRVTDFGLARLAEEPEEPRASSRPARPPGESAETEGGADDWSFDAPAEGAGVLGAPLTLAGGVVGTPRYMAPEQRDGPTATVKGDQYSFCVALWEAAFGALPPERRRWAPRWLARTLARGLATDPAARYPSMAELLHRLERTPIRRRRLVWVGAVALLTGTVAVAAWALAPSRAVTCELAPARARAAEVWDEATRRDVEKTFLATGRPQAGAVFARLEALVGQRLDDWAAAHREACAATHLRGEQSPALLDRRMACLERARGQLGALLQIWRREVELDGALLSAMTVGDVARCADTPSLVAAAPLPADPEQRRLVEAVRRQIDTVDAGRQAGLFRSALEQARTLTKEARGLGDPGSLANALWEQGWLECETGEHVTGIALLQEATVAAAEAADDVQQARALRDLMRCTGNSAYRLDEAMALAPAAEAAVARAGGRADLRYELLQTESFVLYRLGRLDESRRRADRALALAERQHGPDHPAIARLLPALADAETDARRSVALYERAIGIYERTLGAEYPPIAWCMNGITYILLWEGELTRAAGYAERSLALRRRVYPAEHAQVARGLVALGKVRLAERRLDEAAALLEEGLAIRERSLGPGHVSTAATLNDLAKVESALGRHPAALAHAERGLAVLEKTLGEDHGYYFDALVTLATVRLEAGDLAGARAAGERAVALRRSRKAPSASPLLVLGKIALAERRWEDAGVLFADALTLEETQRAKAPDMVAALVGLGEARLGAGRPREALPLATRAVHIAAEREGFGTSAEAVAAKALLARLPR